MPEIIFNGPCGRLEGRYTHSKEPNAPVALILHPNPEQGGTMNNRMTVSLFQTFANKGFSTLRFNFRGVGRSQGTADQGEGELCDAAAALDWLQRVNPNSTSVWVAGFSYGAWISMQLLMRRPEIVGYVSIAPPTNLYDFNFLAPCPNEGLIVHAEEDKTVTEESVLKLIEKLREQRGPMGVDFRTVPNAGHFFTNELDQVLGHVDDYLTTAMSSQEVAA